MALFFIALTLFTSLTTLINSGILHPDTAKTAIALNAGIGYIVLASFFIYVVLRFKETSDRFDQLLAQREKIQQQIAKLVETKNMGGLAQDSYVKYMEEYNSLLNAINKAISPRQAALKLILRKKDFGIKDRTRFMIVNFFSTRKIKLDDQATGKLPKEDVGKIFRLVMSLSPYRNTYSRNEIMIVMLEEGYTKKVVDFVTNVLYG